MAASHDANSEAGAPPARGRISFVPLENNPEVMTSLVHKLGLSPGLSWHDVFSLDDPDLLAFVPRPAHALLLVFPVSKAYEKLKAEEDAPLTEYTASGPQEEVLWFKQTIRNACGLYGLLHAVCNGISREFITPSSTLARIISEATPLDPVSRTRVLEASPELATAHASAAATGDTAAPAADADIDLHFVAFVKTAEGHLWELDGGRKGPLNRGKLPDGEDALGDTALAWGPKRFLKREAEAAAAAGIPPEMRFSVLALGPTAE